jgi:hypothetical protein
MPTGLRAADVLWTGTFVADDLFLHVLPPVVVAAFVGVDTGTFTAALGAAVGTSPDADPVCLGRLSPSVQAVSVNNRINDKSFFVFPR